MKKSTTFLLTTLVTCWINTINHCIAQEFCSNPDSIAETLNETISIEDQILSHNNLAWCLASSKFTDAIFHAEQAIKKSIQNQNQEGQFTGILRLGWTNYCFDNIAAAKLHFSEALVLAKKHNNPSQIARVGLNLGNIFWGLNQFDSALHFYKTSFNNLPHDQRYNRSSAAINIARVFKKAGEYDSSFHYFKLAKEIYNGQLTPQKAAVINREMGELKYAIGKYSEALLHYKSSLPFFYENEDLRTIEILNLLGKVFIKVQQYDSAQIYVNQAASLDKEIFGQLHNPDIAINLGILAYQSKDSITARNYFQNAIKLAENTNDTTSLALAYLNLGSSELPLSFGDKAFDIFSKIGDPVLVMRSAEILAYRYRKSGDYKSADRWGLLAKAMNDSIQLAEDELVEYQLKSAEKSLIIEELRRENLKKNLYITIIVIGSILLTTGIVFFARSRIMKASISERDQRIQSLMQKQELAAMDALIKGQEGERKRIAQDLHDRLGSILAMVKLHFSTVEKGIEELQAKARTQYDEANHLLDEACEEVRRVAHDMISGVLEDFGLIAALKNLAESLSKSEKIKMEILDFGFDRRLNRNLEITIYRIVQELIGNTLKHGKASEITIQLIKKEQNLNITVEDNGTGFDLVKLDKQRGLGLRSIKTRVEAVNGTFTIDSHPGKGTLATINIPPYE